VQSCLDAGAAVPAVRHCSTEVPDGTEFYEGDLNVADPLLGALDGVDAVFSLSGYDGLARVSGIS
jgi:uncharacterized protein YbjT (DUF2867 family)